MTTDDDFDTNALEDALASFEPEPGQPVSQWTAKTLGEVAEFFCMALQTVREWRCASPPMPGDPGRYPLKDILQWRMARLSSNELSDESKKAALEKTRVQVEQMRLDLETQKANLLDRASVELWASTALSELRESIMQLPDMLATSAPQELKEFVRAETDRHCRDALISARRRLEMAEIE